jgi:tRNA(adenine34) deaminase
VFGAPDPKGGATGTLYNVAADPRLNHEVDVTHGVLAEESSRLLSDFFALHRNADR